jgi:hypothetical protein
MSERYDTLVVRGSPSQEVPREAAGGQVVSWSAGHALAELGPLEAFVQELADGCYGDESIESIQTSASHALSLSRLQRDNGWIEAEGESDA